MWTKHAHVFELHVTAQLSGRYGITSHSQRLGDAHTSIRLDLKAEWLVDNLLLPVYGQMSWELLEDFGTQLFTGVPEQGYDGLFSGPVLNHYRTCRGAAMERDQPLSIELRIDPPELEALPWELLFDPQDRSFLATSPQCALVRTTTVQVPIPSLLTYPPLQGLIVAATAPDLSLRAEIDALLELASRHPHLLHWEVLESPSTDTFRRSLDSKPVHLVHFCGHGTRSRTQEAKLELATGDSLEARNLSVLLQGRRDLRLVVLNGCWTRQRDPQREFSGAGERLLGGGVPAVIATHWPIRDVSARHFTEAFYAALLEPRTGGHLARALRLARQRLLLEFDAGWPDFANYALYCRALDQHLLPAFEPQSDAQAEPERSSTPSLAPPPVLPLQIQTPEVRVQNPSPSVQPKASTLERLRHHLLGGGSLCVLLVLLRLGGFLDPFDAARERMYGWLEGPRPLDPDLVLVDLDGAPGDGRWSRQDLAKLVERLVMAPPVRGLVLDLVLEPKPPTLEPMDQVTRATERMATALDTFLAGRSDRPRVVVLAREGVLEPAEPEPDQERHYNLKELKPLAAPLEHLPWGYGVMLSPEVDESPIGPADREMVVRGVPLAARVHAPNHPLDGRNVFALASLPFLGESQPMTTAFPPLFRQEAMLAVSGRRLASPAPEMRWIRTDGRLRVEVPHVAAEVPAASLVRGSELLRPDVLEGRGLDPALESLKERLAGKLVVVGYVSQLDLDRVPTLWGVRSGVQVQAGLLSALYTRRAAWRSWELDVVLQILSLALGLLLTWQGSKYMRAVATSVPFLLALEWYCWHGLDLRLHTPVLESMLLAVGLWLFREWQVRGEKDSRRESGAQEGSMAGGAVVLTRAHPTKREDVYEAQ